MDRERSNRQAPDLQIAAFCDYVIQDENGKPSIVGIFNILHANEFPAAFGFWLFTAWINGSGEHSYSVRISLPDGNLLMESEPYSFRFDSPADVVYVRLRLNLRLEKVGDYRFQILLDGQAKLSQVIQVVKSEQLKGR
jgi:hypothetical protein